MRDLIRYSFNTCEVCDPTWQGYSKKSRFHPVQVSVEIVKTFENLKNQRRTYGSNTSGLHWELGTVLLQSQAFRVRTLHFEGSDIITLNRAQVVPLGLWTGIHLMSWPKSSLVIKKSYPHYTAKDVSPKLLEERPQNSFGWQMISLVGMHLLNIEKLQN